MLSAAQALFRQNSVVASSPLCDRLVCAKDHLAGCSYLAVKLIAEDMFQQTGLASTKETGNHSDR